MVELITRFTSLFHCKISFDENLILKRDNLYFLASEELEKFVSADFYYAGTYLGKTRGNRFSPSFMLLDIMAKKDADKVVVDKKTEWLFICGRDIFQRGISETAGFGKEGSYVLVMNQHNECLGFGRIISEISKRAEDVAVENLLDIGDFLRREGRKRKRDNVT